MTGIGPSSNTLPQGGCAESGAVRLFVGVTVKKGRYLDLEKLAAAAFAVD
ncbi:MAG TPA: hypothetical protein VFU71_10410 [Burkholderiaceae bacterium]|nr:hypothetical protein [Burkholderiaceae bacterium]